MRLREIKKTLQEQLPIVSLKVSAAKQSGNNSQKIENLQAVLGAINTIKGTGLFKDIFDQMSNIEEIYLNTNDTIITQKPTFDQFNALIIKLRQGGDIVVQAFDDVLTKQDALSLSIKLPPIKDLRDLTETVTHIDKILQQIVVNSYVNGDIKLQNFDTGTFWIEILVGSTIALNVVISVIRASILLKREALKNQKIIEDIRSHKITNDVVEKMAEQLTNQQSQFLRLQIRDIIKKSNAPDDDHEYQERLRHGINEITELIEKGLQFFPAENASDSIKSDFPDFTKPIRDMLPHIKELPGEVEDSSLEKKE